MTTTVKLDSTSADSPEDYRATIRVEAQPDALFDALTTLTGLAGWWTEVTGSGHADGELRFFFGSADPCIMHVDEAGPSSVVWTTTKCDFLTDWVGTRLAFTITPLDVDLSELHFRHYGMTPELDCHDFCTNSWGHYMQSLRRYVETGQGEPFGSAEDLAWRTARNPAGSGGD